MIVLLCNLINKKAFRTLVCYTNDAVSHKRRCNLTFLLVQDIVFTNLTVKMSSPSINLWCQNQFKNEQYEFRKKNPHGVSGTNIFREARLG